MKGYFKHVMDTIPFDPTPYCHFVSKLLYLFHTHLAIAYVVNVIDQYMQASKVAHLQAMLPIFHYIYPYPSCMWNLLHRRGGEHIAGLHQC
jgi:hypothetical protein